MEGEFILMLLLMGISFSYLLLYFTLKRVEEVRVNICVLVDAVCGKIREDSKVAVNLVDMEPLVYILQGFCWTLFEK